MAVAVHHHHIVGRDRVVPDHLVAGAGAIGHKKAMVCVEDARGIALRGRHRPGVVEQLTQFFHRVADVCTQHVLAKKLVEHLPDRTFEKSHAARVAGAVPGVGAVLGVIQQGLEEWRLHALQIAFGLPDDVARDKLGRVLKHVDEAVQFAQDIVGNMARGLGFAIDVNRYVQVFATNLFNEVAQVQHRRVQVGAGRELLVVDRQDEGAGPTLLLGKLAQIPITGDTQHFKTLSLYRLGQRANAQARRVLGPEILVDDHDRKAKLHGALQQRTEKWQ